MHASKRLRISNIPAPQSGEKAFSNYLATVHNLYAGRDYTHITCFPNHAILTFANKKEAELLKDRLEFTLCSGFHLNVEFDNRKKHVHASENSTVYVHNFKHEDIPQLREQAGKIPGFKEAIIRYSNRSLYAFVEFSSTEQAQFAVTQLNTFPFGHATLKSNTPQNAKKDNKNSTKNTPNTPEKTANPTNHSTKSSKKGFKHNENNNNNSSSVSSNCNNSSATSPTDNPPINSQNTPEKTATFSSNCDNSSSTNPTDKTLPPNSPSNSANTKIIHAVPSKYASSRSKYVVKTSNSSPNSPIIPSNPLPVFSPTIFAHSNSAGSLSTPNPPNSLTKSNPTMSPNPLSNTSNSSANVANSTNPHSNSSFSKAASPIINSANYPNSSNSSYCTHPRLLNPTSANPLSNSSNYPYANSTNSLPLPYPSNNSTSTNQLSNSSYFPQNSTSANLPNSKNSTSKSRQFPVYIAELPKDISKNSQFSAFVDVHTQGAIFCVYMGCKSRYGFANYSSLENATNAINKLNGMVIGETKLVAKFTEKSNKEHIQPSSTFQTSTLKVENLSPMIKDDLLRKIFCLATSDEAVLGAHVVTYPGGASKQFGFVEFANQEMADLAHQKMHGKTFMDNSLALSHDKDQSVLKVMNIPYALVTEELKDLIQQHNEEYFLCFVPRKKDGTSPGFGIVLVESIDAGKKLIEKLGNINLQGRPIDAILCNSNLNSKIAEKTNAVHKIEDIIDVKRREQLELYENSLILKKQQQESLVATKEQLEERLKVKRERQLKEENIRKELEEYKDQLRLAKLEKEIEQFKIQKEQHEREMAILASIDSLNAQKEVHDMQQNISKFEEEINEMKNIKQEILMLQAKKKAYDIEMECAPPIWEESETGWEPKEPAQLYMFKIDKGRLETVWHRQCTVQIAPKPFGRGTFRLAYWLKLWDKKDEQYSGTSQKFVAKRPIASQGENDMGTCKQDILTQMYAGEMAKLFCSMNVPKRVEYVPIFLICLTTRPEKTYMTIEGILDGEWKRYSNNMGYVHSESAATVHAFSHFTYEHSTGPKKIVVDIQGVKHENTFMLTDPSIHCEGSRIYGESNLGEEGINEFFKTHSCNHICQSLKLTKHPLQSKQDLM